MKYNSNEPKAVTNRELAQLALVYALLLLSIVLLFSKVLLLSIIPSTSMASTIEAGGMVIANRLDCEDIQRYDIMVFRSPEKGSEDLYIKRVIGLPGETITVAGGKVYAGTELLDSSFLAEEMDRRGEGVYQVPEGCYFMMGDNRNKSCDSRFWGDGTKYKSQYVPLEDMVAKAELSVWPLNQIGSLAWHEDKAQPQEENAWQNLTCGSCGTAGTLVETDVIGYAVQREDGSIGWETVGVELQCLACGEIRNMAEDGEICPACGMEQSMAEDTRRKDSEPAWSCVNCGEKVPG